MDQAEARGREMSTSRERVSWGPKEADFKFLLSTLGLTIGNLSVQAGKLEGAGYVANTNSFEGKIPCMRYQLADLGRECLAAFWQEIDEIRATGQARGRPS